MQVNAVARVSHLFASLPRKAAITLSLTSFCNPAQTQGFANSGGMIANPGKIDDFLAKKSAKLELTFGIVCVPGGRSEFVPGTTDSFLEALVCTPDNVEP